MNQDDVQPERGSPPLLVGRLVHLPWLDAFWLMDLIQEAGPRRRGASSRLLNARYREIAASLRRQIKEIDES